MSPPSSTTEHPDPAPDALALIRRNARPLSIASGPGDPRTARILANWAVALALAVPALWLAASAAPEPILTTCAIVALVLVPLSLTLGLGSLMLAPRSVRGWFAIALILVIAASAIGLTISSGDFGR
jgi:FtsH-binding integral membrane protein